MAGSNFWKLQQMLYAGGNEPHLVLEASGLRGVAHANKLDRCARFLTVIQFLAICTATALRLSQFIAGPGPYDLDTYCPVLF